MNLKKSRACAVALVLAVGQSPDRADAGFLDDVWKKAKPFVIPPLPTRDRPIPIPQPPHIPGLPPNLQPPKPPASIDDFKRHMAERGSQLGNVAAVTYKVSSLPLNTAGAVVAQVGGQKASAVFDFITAGERFQREFAFTAAASGAAVLQGQDPLIGMAMPLAAAIRAAREQHIGRSQPLPPQVIELFSQFIPLRVLQNARYTRGEVRLSLPSIINGAQHLFHNEHAVTVDNVIVFSKSIDFDSIDDLVWLGHEVFHTKQYADWGIDLFAFNYLKNSRAVEDEARQAASYVRSYLEQLAQGQSPNPRFFQAQAPDFAAQPVTTPLGQTVIYKAPTAGNPFETTAGGIQPSPDGGIQPRRAPQPGAGQPPQTLPMPPQTFGNQCFINGQPIPVQKVPPLDQRCVYDIIIPTGFRACVVPGGAVFVGQPVPIGHCP